MQKSFARWESPPTADLSPSPRPAYRSVEKNRKINPEALICWVVSPKPYLGSAPGQS